jgi:hypothetical protein
MVEMKKDGTGKHDQVVNTLLDLQARLRAEGVPDTTDEVITIPDAAPPATDQPATAGGAFAPVTQLPTSGAADDRIATLTERLSRLEFELRGVMAKIDDTREDRIADRVVRLEQRMLHEIASQRADMAMAIEAGFQRLEGTISEAWREAVHADDNGDTPAPS